MFTEAQLREAFVSERDQLPRGSHILILVKHIVIQRVTDGVVKNNNVRQQLMLPAFVIINARLERHGGGAEFGTILFGNQNSRRRRIGGGGQNRRSKKQG
jgi:hypothetical protein